MTMSMTTVTVAVIWSGAHHRRWLLATIHLQFFLLCNLLYCHETLLTHLYSLRHVTDRGVFCIIIIINNGLCCFLKMAWNKTKRRYTHRTISFQKVSDAIRRLSCTPLNSTCICGAVVNIYFAYSRHQTRFKHVLATSVCFATKNCWIFEDLKIGIATEKNVIVMHIARRIIQHLLSLFVFVLFCMLSCWSSHTNSYIFLCLCLYLHPKNKFLLHLYALVIQTENENKNTTQELE